MRFTVDTENKIIFGWSAKCGCSRVKSIFWFFKTGKTDIPIHTSRDLNKLPPDIENYTTFVFIRNPYLRLISGFLDKYKKNGEYRKYWKKPILSFQDFVGELINNNWEIIQKHHFCPQTQEDFNKNKLLDSKVLKVYDIGNIDYQYMEEIYERKIPSYLINKSYGNERNLSIKNNLPWNQKVYDLHIDDYHDYKIDTKYFYNLEIYRKVTDYFKDDFNFFKIFGINYHVNF